MNQPIQKKPTPSLPRAARPGAEQPALLRRFLSHSGWSRAITGKFQQRTNLLGWRPESLVYRLHAAAHYILFRNLQRFHLASRASDAGRPQVNQFIFRQTNVFHSALRAGKETPGAHPERRETSPGALSPRMIRREESFLPLERVAERFRFFRDGLRGMVLFTDSGQDAIEIRKRILRYENARPDALLLDLAGRIARQSRRMEERPLDPPPNLASGAPAVHGTGDFVLELPRFVPVKETGANSGPDTMPGAPPAMPVNVAHLTDEVMRQLDHRMIAARERMCKI
jgi:hypothetical protein